MTDLLVQNFLVSLQVQNFPAALVALHYARLVEPLHVKVQTPPVAEGDVVTPGTLEGSGVAVDINSFPDFLSLELFTIETVC